MHHFILLPPVIVIIIVIISTHRKKKTSITNEEEKEAKVHFVKVEQQMPSHKYNGQQIIIWCGFVALTYKQHADVLHKRSPFKSGNRSYTCEIILLYYIIYTYMLHFAAILLLVSFNFIFLF